MKFLISAIVLVIGVASAQSNPSTSTITLTPACPTAPAADVIVTRSAVAAPPCAALNGTAKPSIISVSVNGTATASGRASGTGTGSMPQFTGAAGRVVGAGSAVVLGAVVAMFV